MNIAIRYRIGGTDEVRIMTASEPNVKTMDDLIAIYKQYGFEKRGDTILGIEIL